MIYNDKLFLKTLCQVMRETAQTRINRKNGDVIEIVKNLPQLKYKWY